MSRLTLDIADEDEEKKKKNLQMMKSITIKS